MVVVVVDGGGGGSVGWDSFISSGQRSKGERGRVIAPLYAVGSQGDHSSIQCVYFI